MVRFALNILGFLVYVVIVLAGPAAVAETEEAVERLTQEVYATPGMAERLVADALESGEVTEIRGQVVLAEAFYRRNEFDASMRELAKAEALITEERTPRLYAKIQTLAAQNFYRLGSMDQAMIAARDVQAALRETPDPPLLAQSYNIVAAIELASGDRQNALKHFALSLSLFEELESLPEIAKLNNNLGVLYIEDGRYHDAEPHLLKSLELSRELNRTTTIIANLVNLAELDAQLGRFGSARDRVKDCFSTVESIDASAQVWCHEAAGEVLQLEGRVVDAVEELKAALIYATDYGLRQHVVDNARQLAEMLGDLGRSAEASAMSARAYEALKANRDELLQLQLAQSDAIVEYERSKSELAALKLQAAHREFVQRLLAGGVSVLVFLLLLSVWLVRSRGRALRTLAEVSDLNEQLAMTDGLTDLPNRRGFWQSIHAFERRHDNAECYALLLMDIDHFKAINDQHGHEAGDQVLVEMAEILRVECPTTAFAARWGGEEFVVMLPFAEERVGLAFGEKIRVALQMADLGGFKVTASIGVAARRGRRAADVIAAADAAMYAAKEAGRNRVVAEDALVSAVPQLA